MAGCIRQTGYIDEDGYIYINSRLKEMIISGGENIYPAEIERVLLECAGVKEAVVFGIPDLQWGEAVRGDCRKGKRLCGR